jgi:hypothetical protein
MLLPYNILFFVTFRIVRSLFALCTSLLSVLTAQSRSWSHTVLVWKPVWTKRSTLLNMSEVLITNGKRAKHDGCDVVLNICKPLRDVLTDLQNPTALPVLNIVQRNADSGESVHERLSGNVQVVLNTCVRGLFPKQK